MPPRPARAAAALIGLVLSACTAAPPACMVGNPALDATLYFGRSIRGGGSVTDAQWQDFLAGSVTPRFPDGLTVLDGRGQWRQRDSGRIVGEPSTVVVIVTDDSPVTRERLDAIRREYRALFQQESVGLVTNPACASF